MPQQSRNPKTKTKQRCGKDASRSSFREQARIVTRINAQHTLLLRKRDADSRKPENKTKQRWRSVREQRRSTDEVVGPSRAIDAFSLFVSTSSSDFDVAVVLKAAAIMCPDQVF